AVRRARQSRHRAYDRVERGVPVLTLRGRAPLIHGQHDHAQPGLAQEGPGGCAAHESRRRRAARRGERRPRAHLHPARQRGGQRRAVGPDAAWPRVAAERPRPRLPRRERRTGRDGGGAERADAQRGSRLDRRHALAQEHAGPGGGAVTGAAIVGAGDYIGDAIARRFAAEGYTVFLGRRHGEKLAPLVAEIEAHGGRAVGRSLDARKEDDITAFLRDADAAAPLEVCIFNVGANVSFPLVDTTERVFRKVWEMACYGGFLTAPEAARLMLARRRGSVFLTGATGSLRGGPGPADVPGGHAGAGRGVN